MQVFTIQTKKHMFEVESYDIPMCITWPPLKYMTPPNEWPRSDHDNERSPPTSSLHVALLAWDVGIRDVVEVGSVVAYHGLTKHKSHGNLQANQFTPKFPNLPFMFAPQKKLLQICCAERFMCSSLTPQSSHLWTLRLRWPWCIFKRSST